MSKLFYIALFMPMMIFAAVKSDFYLWQRNQNKPVQNFYKNSSGHLYFLAGEIENDGKIITVKQSLIAFDRTFQYSV